MGWGRGGTHGGDGGADEEHDEEDEEAEELECKGGAPAVVVAAVDDVNSVCAMGADHACVSGGGSRQEDRLTSRERRGW